MISNVKGISDEDRFIDVISDPNNQLIKRVKDAGSIIDDYIVMHNGIKVVKGSYYGNFEEIFLINKGCHEPGEERMFQEVLKHIPDGGLMIELGSYWSFYTIWFNRETKNAKNYCIEPSSDNLDIGKRNCKLNNVTADFTNGFIGTDHINISDFVKEKGIKYIDMLHCDIQGYEVQMLNGIVDLLANKKVGYLFISSHSDKLHYTCIDILKEYNYRIIASADFETETFCFDGIIVACHEDDLDVPDTYLGCRKYAVLKHINT